MQVVIPAFEIATWNIPPSPSQMAVLGKWWVNVLYIAAGARVVVSLGHLVGGGRGSEDGVPLG